MFAIDGNEGGSDAPGLRDRAVALQVAHNALVAHGAAVPIIRRRCVDAQVGIALNFSPAYPATESEADQVATRLFHARFNRWFLDPIMGRGYPEEAWEYYAGAVPEIVLDDAETMAAPFEYLGVNYYTRTICQDPTGGSGRRALNRRDPARVTARDWEIYPQGLYDLLTWLSDEYRFGRMFVTENGAAYADAVAADGGVHDPLRQAYIRQHLEMLLRALAAAVPVRGYFCWSLLDNFEWAFGTSSRFGLAYTDFTTQRRMIKDSGRWYGRVARANALVD